MNQKAHTEKKLLIRWACDTCGRTFKSQKKAADSKYHQPFCRYDYESVRIKKIVWLKTEYYIDVPAGGRRVINSQQRKIENINPQEIVKLRREGLSK